MRFFVIYSFDITADLSVKYCAPPRCRAWRQTEGDEQYEDFRGEDTKGKHRKYCGELTRKQFDEFVKHCGLQAEDVETMGSMIGFGECLPAISFNGTDERVDYQNAYVTPIPEVKHRGTAEWEARTWVRIRDAVLMTYGTYSARRHIEQARLRRRTVAASQGATGSVETHD